MSGQKIYDEALVKATLRSTDRETDKPVDEGAIGAWLDEIYSGEIAETWQREFAHATAEFDATCIRTLRAFQTDRSLEELFYKAFDSVEVLPNDLYDDFMRLKEDEPIVPTNYSSRFHGGDIMHWRIRTGCDAVTG